MAKVKSSKVSALKSKKQKKDHLHIALTKLNYMIIGGGLLLIIIGYVLMSENSVDGFMPTVVAPILLFLGYCVLIPLGILYKDKGSFDYRDDGVKITTKESQKSEDVQTATSNIKTG